MKVEKLLAEFKKEAYRNAIRLFRDAALLYSHGAYPSSFFLAVAAFEEVGKAHVIDRGCDMICMNPDNADDLYDMYFRSAWLTDHRHKQRWAFFDANGIMPSRKNPAWMHIDTGGLEYARQQALYVELSNKKVGTPQRVKKEKTFDMLTKCQEAIIGTGDLGFSGFAAESTSKSEWLINQAIDEVKGAFERCVEHNKSR